MREVTYGWYPSVTDIYRPKGRPSSHHLECLYNFKDYQGQIVTREPELFVRGVSSARSSLTSQDSKRKSKSVPIPTFFPESKIHIPTPIECWSKRTTPPETQWGVSDSHVPQSPNLPSEVSWPPPQESKQPQQKYLEQKHQQQHLLKEDIQQHQEKYNAGSSQTPDNAWGFRKSNRRPSSPCSEASSGLTWPVAHSAYPLRPQSSYSMKSTSYQQDVILDQKQRPVSSPVKLLAKGPREKISSLTPAPPSGKNRTSSKRPVRIQSATVRHEKIPLPARPVTAATSRQSLQEQEIVVPISSHSEVETPPTRPAEPVPFANDIRETASELQEATKLSRSQSPYDDDDYDNYEKIVEKYGWRAQIHGDPYQLKKPMKRQSYIVKCSAPKLLPDPPSVHMETKEPFFYNTIPRRPLSFSVDREWMSEVLLAKRLELQKREGGIKYNYRNFAFVY